MARYLGVTRELTLFVSAHQRLRFAVPEVRCRCGSEHPAAVQQSARDVAGRKFILTPGCSVPNDSTEEELFQLP